MNERYLANLLKAAVAGLLFYTGLSVLVIKLAARRGLLVFNYHGFNSFINDYWKFGSLFQPGYRRRFLGQVRFYERHFRKDPGIGEGLPSGSRCAYLLTFDDGYKDNFDIAIPILKKYSIPAVFFPVTSVIGTGKILWFDAVRLRHERQKPRNPFEAARVKSACKRALERAKMEGPDAWAPQEGLEFDGAGGRLMMTWDEVRAAAEAGITIGAHTHTHPILSRLDPDAQSKEIRTSIDLIREKTGIAPVQFSYPDGDPSSYDQRTLKALREAGIRSALTTVGGINRPGDPALELRRIGVNPSDPVPVVALKIASEGLKTIVRRGRWAGEFRKARLALHQYGAKNALKRALKRILRAAGVRLESNFILSRDLDGPVSLPPPPEGLEARRLSFEDYRASRFYSEFSPEKRELLKSRFADPAYRAYGAYWGGDLVYLAWIATDFLRIETIGFENKLAPGEGVLLDALALPEARGRGIHNYMNMFRLARLQEMGIRKALVAVLAENRPALKTQIKSGFGEGEKLSWIAIGKARRLTRKPVVLGEGIGRR